MCYSPNQKEYKCYSRTLQKVFVSKYATFFESELYFSPTLQGENLGKDEYCDFILQKPILAFLQFLLLCLKYFILPFLILMLQFLIL